MKQAAGMGLDGFLIKPVSPSILFDTIMEVFWKGHGMSVRKRGPKTPGGKLPSDSGGPDPSGRG